MHWFLKLSIAIFSIILFWFYISFIIPKIMPAQHRANTEVSGLLFRDQIWEGTIRVKGDIITTPGVKVTLKPGTVILVALSGDVSNFDFLPWHRKAGVNTKTFDHGVRVGEPFWDEGQKIQMHFHHLEAKGTEEQPITITSDNKFGSPYDFNVLEMKKGILSHVNVSNYRRLEVGKNVIVEHSGFENVGECSICIKFGDPTLFKNTFDRSLRENIYIEEGSPRITDNLFVNLSGDGIRMDPRRFGKPIISHNTFEMPGKIALDIQSGEEDEGGVVSFNKFAGNTQIIIACDSKIKFVENALLGVISFKGAGCEGQYEFGSNYWGIINKDTILKERFVEKNNKYKIVIPSLLASPSATVGKR